MTIKLTFIRNRELFRLTIKDKQIYYCDRIWKSQIRLIPKDKDFVKKIIKSRNKIPKHFIELFDLTKTELKEYESAKTDKDLAKICINDARKQGAILQKKEGLD